MPPGPQISVTKTADTTVLTPGGSVTYTIVVGNVGSVDAPNTPVSDPVPSGITAFAWTCASTGGAVCPNASGSRSDQRNDRDLAAPEPSVTYTVLGDDQCESARTVVTNAATATPTNGVCSARQHAAAVFGFGHRAAGAANQCQQDREHVAADSGRFGDLHHRGQQHGQCGCDERRRQRSAAAQHHGVCMDLRRRGLSERERQRCDQRNHRQLAGRRNGDLHGERIDQRDGDRAGDEHRLRVDAGRQRDVPAVGHGRTLPVECDGLPRPIAPVPALSPLMLLLLLLSTAVVGVRWMRYRSG